MLKYTTMILKTGTILHNNSYCILKTLGRGGFGITYLAEQIMTQRKVCIKEFFPKDYYRRDGDSTVITLASDGFAEAMNRFKAKFIKEAQTIATLDHPNIVHIYEAFEENGTAYYVMEYIDGESLNDIVKRSGAMAESEAVTFIKQVAPALEYIHNKQIMHLDIKPGNIMVRRSDARAIIIDFGLSKHYDASSGEATSTTPVGVSYGFAPIEQYKPGGVSVFSPETDIYSLGATLYYLVTGNIPPLATDISEDGLPSLPKCMSNGVRVAIERSMEDKRRNRPHSIGAFIALLECNDDKVVVENDSDITQVESMHRLTTQDPIRSKSKTKRRWWIWLTLFPLLILIGVLFKESLFENVQEQSNMVISDESKHEGESVIVSEVTSKESEIEYNISRKQQIENRVKNFITSFYVYSENNDFDNLKYLYASNVDRFHSLYNITREEVMRNWMQYDTMFKVKPNTKQYSVVWNSLKIAEDGANILVEYEVKYSMGRYEPNKPSWFHLKVYMKLNASYEIVSIYEDILQKH